MRNEVFIIIIIINGFKREMEEEREPWLRLWLFCTLVIIGTTLAVHAFLSFFYTTQSLYFLLLKIQVLLSAWKQ